jgi:hypothetical protein
MSGRKELVIEWFQHELTVVSLMLETRHLKEAGVATSFTDQQQRQPFCATLTAITIILTTLVCGSVLHDC